MLALVAFAEFLLDGLELLAQIELALALRELALHLGLNLLAQFQQFYFARQLLVDVFEALRRIVFLEHQLAFGVPEAGQSARDEIGQTPDFRDVARRRGDFVGKIWA